MPKAIRTALVMLAAVMLSCSAEGLANTLDVPASFQGRWRGTSCVVESAFKQFSADIVDRLKLRIRQSVLTVTPSSFTRTPSTIARMSSGSGIKASTTLQPLSDILHTLNIQMPAVLGEPLAYKESTVLKGVSLTIAACQVGPLALVVRPGQPRPSGAPIPMQVCKPTFMFHYPDADHLAMPSDGLLGCLEIFERIPPESKSL